MIIMSFNNKQPYKEKSYSENINDVQINKPEIQQIIIKHYGGRSLNDSIVYVINNKSFEFHVYSKNKEKSSSKVKELEEGIFLNLTKKLDLSDFKKITNGKSFQATDGYDTEIRILTKNEIISKTNGFGNKNWVLITSFKNSFNYN